MEKITECKCVWVCVRVCDGEEAWEVGWGSRVSNSVHSSALLSSIHCPHPVCVLLLNGF